MRFLTSFTAAIILAAPAYGQYSSRCSTDYFGNVTCRSSDGYRLNLDRDYFGNTRSTITTPDGDRTRCTSTRDYFGNVNTRCW
jgi:hypothetical protein